MAFVELQLYALRFTALRFTLYSFTLYATLQLQLYTHVILALQFSIDLVNSKQPSAERTCLCYMDSVSQSISPQQNRRGFCGGGRWAAVPHSDFSAALSSFERNGGMCE